MRYKESRVDRETEWKTNKRQRENIKATERDCSRKIRESNKSHERSDIGV